MDSLSYPIFVFISSLIRYEFNVVMDQAYLNFVSSVVHIAVAVEVIYVIHFGYCIMFGKAINASIGTPSIEKLLYHLFFTGFIVALISVDKTPLDLLSGFRGMLLQGLTNSSEPAGQQAANGLSTMHTAFVISNALTSLTHAQNTSDLAVTNISLALMTEVSPQITASIMLLINELMVKIGMALCPLMIYAALYQNTKNLFNRWLIYMVSLTIQVGVLALTTVIAAKVTGIFLGTFTPFALASRATQGAYFISELQQSAIQAGFGMTITALLIWFPNNAAAFGGSKLYDKTTKSSLGTLGGLRSKYK